MSSICCSFCNHANPCDAKYCNECGNTLGLRPCDVCDAVNDLNATRCHVCDATLGETSAKDPTADPCSAVWSVTSATDTTDADASAAVLNSTSNEDASTFERTPTPDESASVVRALERFHADLATIRRARSSHKTRRLFVASVVLVAAAGVFAGDQHESARSSTNVSDAMPARFAEAATASQAAQQLRVDSMSVRKAPIPASPRATSGAIGNLPASQLSLALPAATMTSDGTRAASTSNVATTAMESPGTRGAPHRALTRVMTESVTREPASEPVESLPYPIAPGRCTQSVAALGLCRGQDIAHAQ
jgi:hypothetical protein